MLKSIIKDKPWAIIIAWIIIIALLANYAAQINDVVLTETESFLPETVESVKAENMLQNLTEQYAVNKTMEPDYLIAIQGVPVSLDTYYKLKEPYITLENETNDSLVSWINIVYQVESQIKEGMIHAINGTLQAVNGTVMLNQAYKNTYAGINTTSHIIIGLDTGYSQLYQASLMTSQQVPEINNTIQGYLTACNKFLPTLAYTTADIIRTEAALETQTNAYQTLNLTQQDIATVINATNLTAYGIPPVQPDLVQTTYYYVLSIGGPTNFTNIAALNLASQLVLQQLQTQIPQDQLQSLLPIYNATLQQLETSLSQSQDLKQIVISNPGGLEQGQLALYQEINQIVQQTRQTLPSYITRVLQQLLPPEQSQLLYIVQNLTEQYSCNQSYSDQILYTTIKSLLLARGLNESPLVDELVQEIINEDIQPTTVMAIIASSSQEQIPTDMVPPRINITEMINQITQIILEKDPDGQGILATPANATYLAAILSLKQSNITLTPEINTWLQQNSTSIENETLTVMRIIIANMMGDQGVSTLELLHKSGLLGVDNETLLARLPELLAPSIAVQANMTEREAQEIINSAILVYKGESTIEEEAIKLTRNILPQAFDSIIEEIKGLLVQRDLQGFLVAYTPENASGNNIDEFKNISARLETILRDAGYNPEIHLGGTMYMEHEIREGALRDIQRSDRISMVLVLIILAIVLESIAAVILPFIGIGFGLMLGLAGAVILAKAGIVDVTTHSRTIMYTTGLGLGIDYAAYVSKRFREAYAKDPDPREAAAEAFSKSWKPVLAGALTATIGFGSMLLASDFPFLSSIGGNAPLAILGVMIASITFIPALLAIVGGKDWFWWPRHPREKTHEDSRTARVLYPLVKTRIIPLAVVLLLAVGAYTVMAGFTGSYDMSLNLPRDSETAKTNEIINTYYDPGVLYPVYIVTSSPDKAEAINQSISQLSCVAKVVVPAEYNGRLVRAYMSVNPLSYEGIQCAEQIRDLAHQVDPGSLVGGMSAVNLDLRNLINSVFYNKVYPVAITLMFLTMLIAYGGLLTSIAAILSVVLAAYTASAITILVYSKIIGIDVLWYLPVIVFTAILGVGMDYNSFYLARLREECEKECGSQAIKASLAHATPIVLGLATIMAGAYIGLAATSTPGLSQMGTALVLGVLLAGLYASVLLTPPLVLLLRNKAWWPRTIRRGEGRRRQE